MTEVVLEEWQRAEAGPDTAFPALNGLFMDSPSLRRAVAGAPPADQLGVAECRHGLVLQARHHVGVVQLGPLRVCIQPKLPHDALWAAVAFALGLDDLLRRSRVRVDTPGDFVELLAQMVLAEADRLWRCGAHRGYRPTVAWLSQPRGRPDVLALARAGPLMQAALPCRYHAHTADVIENQVVLAGVVLAQRLTRHLPLRAALRRSQQQWSTACRAIALGASALDAADRARNRLTARYAGVHALVRLLHDRAGLDAELQTGAATVRGFLWNMATVFERFVGRFLTRHFAGHEVLTQHGLSDLYAIVRPGPKLQRPRPRPDIVIRRREDAVTTGVYDTKYRDLWETPLPREILYQMSVYALAWSEAASRDVPAVVLYPAVSAARPDMELSLRVHGGAPRRIVLRGVDWAGAARLVAAGDATGAAALATRWTAA